MSASRDVIADVHGIPEDEVKCKNCQYAENFINDMYICKFWGDQGTRADAFCSLFRKENGNER